MNQTDFRYICLTYPYNYEAILHLKFIVFILFLICPANIEWQHGV